MYSELVTQKNLLTKANSKVWNDGVAQAKDGVSLDQLGPILEQSLKAYGVNDFKVEVIHTENASAETKKKIHDLLVKNEKNSNDFN